MKRFLTFAAAVALTAGFLDAGVLGVRRFLLDRLIWVGPGFFWMTPAAYVLLLAPLVVVLAAPASRWPSWADRWGPGVVTLVAAFSLLWHVKVVHPAALAVVAAGVAVQVVRRFGPGTSSGLPARLARVLGGGLLALVMIGLLLDPVRTRLALRSLPDADPAAPNIVVVILDTVRALELDLYGYPRPTAPNLTALARGSIVFDRAMSPSPSSLPGHAALLTGLLPHQIRADWRTPLEKGPATLPEVLAGAGYATAAVSGNLFYFTRESGLGRGFHRFEGYGVSPAQIVRSASLGQLLLQTGASLATGGGFQAPVGWITEGKPADRVLSQAGAVVRSRPDRPLFLVVNLLDAHLPYDPPEPFRSRFLRGCVRTMSVPACVAQTRVDRYDAAIAHVDDALGRLLADLEAEGVLENAVVVVTSDHGEHLGERNLLGHGNSLYWPALHVPLVIRLPDGPRGVRVETPVSLTQVPGTLARLAGVGTSGLAGTPLALGDAGPDGTTAPDTLVASAKAGINRPPVEPLSRGDMYAALAWPYHYIRNGDGSEELYHVERDPLVTRDLMGTPLGPAVAGPLRAVVERARRP